jgi:hypothetical protein
MKTRKTLILIIIVLLVSATGAFAATGGTAAVGVEGALNFGQAGGMPMGAMILLHFPQVPIMWGIGLDSAMDIGLTGDYWFTQGTMASILSWYVGIGGYMYLGLGSDPVGFSAGARIPLALQLWPFGRKLEFFIEVAPALGISIIPTGFDWHLQSAIGLRYWF